MFNRSENAPNIVPFQRSAEYLHQRAMKNKRTGNPLDALELLRRALEKDPENVNYMMDQAELLCEMGCHMESNEILAEIYAQEDTPNECLFGICCNFYGMNDPESAYHALTFFLSGDPAAVKRSEVSDMLENLAIVREFGMPAGRKKRRAARLAKMGLEYLQKNDFAHAEQWMRKSLEIFKNVETRAFLALALSHAEQHDEAVAEADLVLSAERPSIKSQCIAARVYARAGMPDRAQETLTHAEESLETYDSPVTLLLTACDLELHEMAGKWAQKMLVETPYDKRLLHIYAVARINTGAPPEQMIHYWARIRRIDPDDTIAPYYHGLAERGTLIPPLPYDYQVQDAERIERVKYLSDVIGKGVAHIESTFENSDVFRQMLKWALFSDEPYFSKVALNVLSVMEKADTQALLRAFLLAPHAPESQKRHALLLLGVHGAKQPFLVLSDKGFAMARVNKAQESVKMPMRCRRVLKIAIRRAMPMYGDLTVPLTELWLSFLQKKRGGVLTMKHPDGWAAGLLYCHITKSGKKPPSIAHMSELFGCSIRMMMHCAREIGRAEKEEERTREID